MKVIKDVTHFFFLMNQSVKCKYGVKGANMCSITYW